MYRKILTAVNEHLNSEITARYAMNLARVCDAKLYLCFIAEKGLPSASLENAGEAMRRIFLEASEMDLRVETITETGDPVRMISEIVRNENIDIVFASTRREDVEKRFFAGTVARRLLLALISSVALVRVVHIGRIHPKEILVPLKARIDHVEELAYFTAKIAQSFGSNTYLFHAPKPLSTFFHGELHLSPLEWEKKLPDDISHFMEHLRRYKIIHNGRLVQGITGRSITTEALSKRHDLIIMGASERSLLFSILKGNPVEELLRDTPCDLIILKPRHENTGS